MKYVVITHPAGQLGNRIVQMANLMLYAEKKGAVLINPGFDVYEYAQYFPFFNSQIFCSYPTYSDLSSSKLVSHKIRMLFLYVIRLFIKFKIVKYAFLDNGNLSHGFGFLPSRWIYYLILGSKDVCNLDDDDQLLLNTANNTHVLFVCGWEYRLCESFDLRADKIREVFTPFPEYIERAATVVGTSKGEAELIIGVHIRMGDYRTHKGGRFYYEMDVYREKIQQVRHLFANNSVRFLVCSNEPVRQFFEDEQDICFGSNHIIEDMYSFAKCDYIIGPPSTYTGWASFYGKVPFCMITHSSQKIKMGDFIIFNQQAFLRLDQELK